MLVAFTKIRNFRLSHQQFGRRAVLQAEIVSLKSTNFHFVRCCVRVDVPQEYLNRISALKKLSKYVLLFTCAFTMVECPCHTCAKATGLRARA